MPLILVSEALMPTTTRFGTQQTIEINAPPSVVWRSIVRMAMRDEPVALPYRLGLAYPLGGDVVGPYEHVHAPHVRGYFLTNLTSFELLPLPGERTQLVERTSHELKLEPILYWMPLARLVIDLNNDRVLRHIKRQAEK